MVEVKFNMKCLTTKLIYNRLYIFRDLRVDSKKFRVKMRISIQVHYFSFIQKMVMRTESKKHISLLASVCAYILVKERAEKYTKLADIKHCRDHLTLQGLSTSVDSRTCICCNLQHNAHATRQSFSSGTRKGRCFKPCLPISKEGVGRQKKNPWDCINDYRFKLSQRTWQHTGSCTIEVYIRPRDPFHREKKDMKQELGTRIIMEITVAYMERVIASKADEAGRKSSTSTSLFSFFLSDSFMKD